MSDEKFEQMNMEILEMNKRILDHNERVVLQNEQYAKEEHAEKMALLGLQKRALLMDMSKGLEPTALHSVGEFHILFGHPLHRTPSVPNEGRQMLRVELIQEELNELEDAFREGDIVEVADALADLTYVVAGTVHECGLGDRFKAIFDEVHRSNMSKACTTTEEAGETIKKYNAEGVECYVDQKADNLFLVYRTSDNKTLKSINYSPANLKPLVE